MLTTSCSPHRLPQASETGHLDTGQMAGPASPGTAVVTAQGSLQHEVLFQHGLGQWTHSAAVQGGEEKSSVCLCRHRPHSSAPIGPVDDPLEQWGFEDG